MAPARTLFYGLVLLLGPVVLIWLASTFERPFICPYDAAISGRLTALVVAECGLALHRKQTRRLVPRIVHQIWKDTNLLAAPTKVLESIVSFNHLNEGHVYVLWTDGDLDMFVRKYFRDLWKLWKSLPHPIFRADLARYLLLKHFGGLYSDCDTRCLKPIDTWFGESGWDERIGAVVGIETDGSKTKNWKAVYPRELHIC
jgi:mannosyltransferase OCH1-like enzyme